MPKQYNIERKFSVAKASTEMKEAGKSIHEISTILDIPQKTIEKWILHLREGKLKLPEVKKPENNTSQIVFDSSEIVKSLNNLCDLTKQTNIRLDSIYTMLAEIHEVKELAYSIVNDD